MSKTEWTHLLVAAAVIWWFAARLDRLGRQLEAVSHLVRREMAQLMGKQARVKELLEEREQDRAAEKMEKRQTWLGLALFGAAALAWWWFTSGQH
jgi:hypothetical protein